MDTYADILMLEHLLGNIGENLGDESVDLILETLIGYSVSNIIYISMMWRSLFTKEFELCSLFSEVSKALAFAQWLKT